MLNDKIAVNVVRRDPNAIRGTLTLSHFIVMNSESGRGKYATLANFYQVKPDDIGDLVNRFREDNPSLENVEICSKFNYTLCDFHR